jgi:hypothetical protein
MNDIRRRPRMALCLVLFLVAWLSAQQPAAAQELYGQTGMAKTMIGWLLALLAIGLGFLVVCRPSKRRMPEE